MAVPLRAASVWGIAGVVLVLGDAVYRLLPIALELKDHALSVVESVMLVGWLAVTSYAEGYRGFQKQFAPRVVARALHLGAHPRPLHVALAPLYCMGLFHATRRRLVTSWVLTLAIIALVLLVRELAQPWRGIVDTGVVVGLTWGVCAIGVFTVLALRGDPMPVPPDVPTVA
jgi:hypothetical protein